MIFSPKNLASALSPDTAAHLRGAGLSRRLVRTIQTVTCGTLLLTGALWATSSQAQEEDFGGDEEGSEEGGEAESGGDEVGGGGGEDAPQSYTVKPGDTLWNLSERFLNNPWYWPKIWSYNPQLDNPNWIRPGTTIRFYPGGEEAPVEVEDNNDGEDEEQEDFSIPDPEDISNFEAKGVSEMLSEMAGRQGVKIRRHFFVPDDTLDEAGKIEAAALEKGMLSQFDSIWIKWKEKPAVGDTALIFREHKELTHPVSGSRLGLVVEMVGRARVDVVDDGKALCSIQESWDVIRREDYIAKLEIADIRRIEPVPNESETKGYVVDTAQYDLKAMGEQHVVFVDKGEKDGVKLGNMFTVVRAIDPLTGDDSGMTDEVIGRVMVTDVRAKVATGLLVFSNREIVAGDRIELRTEGDE